MLEQLQQTQNETRTENGAKAYRSTGSACLDFFSVAGALRGADDARIVDLFVRAYVEEPDYALRAAFYARDVRGGLGERRLFRRVTEHLAKWHPESVIRNIPLFAEYGRYDDLLSLLDTPCEAALGTYLRAQLERDLRALEAGEGVSLLAKWLPSVNTSSAQRRAQAHRVRRLLGLSEREYRKKLAALRRQIDILETRLCRRDYSFDYEKQPSAAMLKYRKAFLRNDFDRYRCYIRDVRAGKAVLNASSIYPYEIVESCMLPLDGRSFFTREERGVLDATWRSLPNWADARNALVVADGSGSMYACQGSKVRPITVAISLAMYFAERNTGHFKDYFITFSATPRLVRIYGEDIVDKTEYCMSYNEISNTDLRNVFMLLLSTAVRNDLPQEELPETLYIISDMEFDEGVNPDETVFEEAGSLYAEYGYRLPGIVYWNVCSHGERQPVRRDEKGVALVSGASPSIFAQAVTKDCDPMLYMRSVLDSERYRAICA